MANVAHEPEMAKLANCRYVRNGPCPLQSAKLSAQSSEDLPAEPQFDSDEEELAWWLVFYRAQRQRGYE